ncbi:unnamed protein product [Cuscuta europaea]|uniref:DUF4283 domain-containing protein n=1 Tax=Cuscuta europaea TaxID=41803 RepID=A0A9P0ZQI9_CUSEU|nr:unnamed protein product [Cuscuta europaea]
MRYKGLPAINFPEEEIRTLADHHKRVLVGYFYKSHPSLTVIRKSFEIIGFSGTFHLGLIDLKHIIIRFESDDDFFRCWNKQSWSIRGSIMCVTKWTPEFRLNVESPIVRVWIGFEGLPLHLQDKRALFEIAGLIGKPLKMDAATARLSRPSVARVCVEIDLTHELPQKIWIQFGSTGFFKSVTYKDKPDYCNLCLHLGNSAAKCPKKNNNHAVMQSTDTTKAAGPLNLATGKGKWVAKQPQQLQITNGETENTFKKVTDPSSSKQRGLDASSRILS